MRSFVVDLFKAVAAQLIVLHHLVAYGPVAAAVAVAMPMLSDWLFDYARMAVQVFIVIGGYLAARSLSRMNSAAVVSSIFKRYQRLVLPFVAALALTTVLAALIRPWFFDAAVPAAPTLGQVFAHLTLLHGVLGFDSLSAGAWYIAIDFQLYALFAVLVLCGRSVRRWHLLLVGLLTAASLFSFNRHSDLDNWALYFFGAYGLGVMAFHISNSRAPRAWLAVLVAVVLAALCIDFRGRILVALSVAVALVLLRNVSMDPARPLARRVAYMGLNSYALFLVHFSFCLLGNALFSRMGWHSPAEGLSMLLLIWLASNLFADVFFKRVELPANRMSFDFSLLRAFRSENA